MLIALRVTAILHAVSFFLQPMLAGMFLSGQDEAIGSHQTNGGVLAMIALVMIVLAGLARRKRLVGPRVLPVVLAIFVLEIVQLTAGTKHVMWLHIPLGVALFATTIATLPMTLRGRPTEEARS
ncbi:hypothetical protein [Nonomuraea sp. NPDC049784]|uniref:hypothetical protein n=1 Tax=Nonomuraea sp. NPDC049784 TaxID=3154361 RepID=UPI0033C68695